MAKKRKSRKVLPAIETVPASLLALREKLGLSKRAMAILCDMHQPEYWRLEAGQRPPHIPTLQRIADGAGVPLTITFGDPP